MLCTSSSGQLQLVRSVGCGRVEGRVYGCALNDSLIVQVPAMHGSRAAFSCASAQMQAKSVRAHVELRIAPMRHVNCVVSSWSVIVWRVKLTAHSGRLSIPGHKVYMWAEGKCERKSELAMDRGAFPRYTKGVLG